MITPSFSYGSGISVQSFDPDDHGAPPHGHRFMAIIRVQERLVP